MSRWRSTRLGASLIALLLGASYAGRIHEALVPHALCPQHGELIELEPGPSPASCVSEESRSELALTAEPEDVESDHEHCAFALLNKQQPSSGDRAPVSMLVSEDRSCEHPAERATESIPLLLLAPKHSPPA